MENWSTNRDVVSNFIWRFAERCGAQGVSFIVSVVLARLLMPEDYGIIAIVTVFTSILQVFVDSGLGTALIQKKDADDVDFSTVFYFNVFFCSILYLLLFGGAPYIAAFYQKEQLTSVIRVLGLTLLISGVKNIQQSYVSRQLLFKRFFFATLIGTICAAFVGIVMAVLGFGVWALVVQGLTNTAIDTVILWITVKWRPRRVFSLSRLRILFSFGWKMLCSSLLGTVYNNIRQLIIGKMYSSADLAFYNKGQQLPNLLVTNINSSIDSVLLPVMSRAQDERGHLKRMMRRSMTTSVYIMAPMMIGLAVVAEPLISLLLTDKWLPCVPFLRIFCISYIFQPIHTANLNAIKAMGRSDLFLKLEIVKKIIGIVLLICTMWLGVLAMAYSLLVSNLISVFINGSQNKKLLQYSYFEQLRDILPSLLLAAIMGVGVQAIKLLSLGTVVELFAQVMLGAAFYVFASHLLKLETFEYLKNMALSYLKRREL